MGLVGPANPLGAVFLADDDNIGPTISVHKRKRPKQNPTYATLPPLSDLERTISRLDQDNTRLYSYNIHAFKKKAGSRPFWRWARRLSGEEPSRSSWWGVGVLGLTSSFLEKDFYRCVDRDLDTEASLLLTYNVLGHTIAEWRIIFLVSKANIVPPAGYI